MSADPFTNDSEDSNLAIAASPSYLILAERVLQTVAAVRNMNASRIKEELGSAGAWETRSEDTGNEGRNEGNSDTRTDSFRRSWRRMQLNICYDRGLCRLLDADYVELSQNDLNRIALCALYLLRWKQDIVLPVL